MDLVIENRPNSYDEFLDQCIAECDALQIKIDRSWKLLQAWRQGEDILISRLRLND